MKTSITLITVAALCLPSSQLLAGNNPTTPQPVGTVSITLSEVPKYLCLDGAKLYSEGASINTPAGVRVCSRGIEGFTSTAQRRASWMKPRS